jgi:hypothetical protein
MELLVPGLILVALMVWASTKIKKNAEMAYQEEVVETDRFVITKPDGFLSPVEPGEGLLFAAYSKDFGTDEADGIRLASAEITEHPEETFAAVRDQLAETTEIISDEPAQKIGETRSVRLTASRAENGVEIKEYVKLVESGDTVFQLRVSVLGEQETAFSDRIETMLDSFRAV